MQAKKQTAQKQSNPAQTKSTSTSSQNQKSSKSASQTSSDKSKTKSDANDKKPIKQEKEQKPDKIVKSQAIDQQQQNQKQEQQQQQQQQQEEEKKQEVPKQKVEGSSIVKYSHYKTSFKHFDGKLQWKLVDEEYCISDVFVGNFKPHIVNEQKQQLQEEISDGQKYFLNLEIGKVYTLIIDEDQEEEQKREHVGYKAQSEESNTVNSKRKEGCSCVFGNPCQDPEACLDWKNKEAVAKKNGWKGFN